MNTKSINFYNKISKFYPLIEFFFRHQKLILTDELNKLPKGNLLDIGIGYGIHLSLYKNHKIIGIDNSPKMLEIAKRNNIKNFELILMNGENLLFEDNKFDYIVLSHVISITNNPEKMLGEIFRVLKPKGQLFILNHFTPDNFMKYLDYAFNTFSKYFYFKSLFYLNQIKYLDKFILIKEIKLGRFSYFKLIILIKP